MKTFLIVGLGNFGGQYNGTNHNIGFGVLDLIAKELNETFSSKRCKALSFDVIFGQNRAVFAKPQTFMNLSGKSVVEFAKKFAIKNENIIVVSDDIDLPPGKVRMRTSGSAGTHNGLRNIHALLGTGDYCRIRIGCGKGVDGQDLADFVLSKIPPENKEAIMQASKEAMKMIFEMIGRT